MNDEIKEILEALKAHNDIKEYPLYLNRKQQDLLYDYITNIQQDLDKANDIIEKDRQFYKCRMDEYVELKQENERLKEECKKWKQNHKAVCIQRDNILDNIVKDTEERIDYKSRCRKAIKSIDIVEEIIKKQPDDFGNGDMWILKRLEGFKFILNGSDEK